MGGVLLLRWRLASNGMCYVAEQTTLHHYDVVRFSCLVPQTDDAGIDFVDHRLPCRGEVWLYSSPCID